MPHILTIQFRSDSIYTMTNRERQYGGKQTIDLCYDWFEDTDQHRFGNEQTTLEGFQHRFAIPICPEKYELGLLPEWHLTLLVGYSEAAALFPNT